MLLPTKKCTKCNRVLLVCKKNFHKNKKGKYGFNDKCKDCYKQYYNDNKEHIKQKNKEYNKDNSEYIKEYHKQWREDNPEYNKQYYNDNKEYIKEYHKQYYNDNKEHYKEYYKEYYENNKEYYKEYMKEYNKTEKHKECNKQYYNDNKEYFKQYYKEYMKQYWDKYLKENGLERSQGSIGEQKVRQVLNQSNITFVEQHRFNDCKFKNTLPFDFYIPSLNTIIEYDGGQHFEITEYFGGLDTFVETIIRDTIKNDYCRRNNIKLIRIPYWEFDNIETILSDLL